MNFNALTTSWCIAAFAAVLLAPHSLLAQAPAGPLPAESPQPSTASSPPAKPAAPPVEVQPRTSILGGWKFNPDESDNPRDKMESSRRNTGGGNPGGIRMGVPGMGGGPYGGHRGYGQNGENEQDRERMQALIAPPRSLALVRQDPKGPEVDLTDDQNCKIALFTDARKLEKSKDNCNRQVAAHWDGDRLVTDEKNLRGGKLSRTFELSYDRRQLYETVEFNAGRSNLPVTIRYVFDQTGGSPAQPQPQAKQ